MKTFSCICGQLISFENCQCVNCQRELGFLTDNLELSCLEPLGRNIYRVVGRTQAQVSYKRCLNHDHPLSCNWMLPSDQPDQLCECCRLDDLVPEIPAEKNEPLWALIGKSKRRLIYTLLRLKLPLRTRKEDAQMGLTFRFLADDPQSHDKIMTGHRRGVITLNLAEADDDEREKRRVFLNEPYRTLLGHLRHEIGHYYWDLLIRDSPYLPSFRSLFGDERVNYGEALKKYYASLARVKWQDQYISVYSTAHPWEDWAEIWAHYLLIQDSLEIALQFGLVDKQLALHHMNESVGTQFTTPQKSFEEKIEAWQQLSIALNNINRCMGLKDIYPFALSKPVVKKLRYIFDVISGHRVD